MYMNKLLDILEQQREEGEFSKVGSVFMQHRKSSLILDHGSHWGILIRGVIEADLKVSSDNFFNTPLMPPH